MSKSDASPDAFGSFIDARDLPPGCKPPYRARTVWTGEHRGWRIVVTRIDGDPAPHVVASGIHPGHGRFQSHAQRHEGATPASAKAWVGGLLDQAGHPKA